MRIGFKPFEKIALFFSNRQIDRGNRIIRRTQNALAGRNLRLQALNVLVNFTKPADRLFIE